MALIEDPGVATCGCIFLILFLRYLVSIITACCRPRQNATTLLSKANPAGDLRQPLLDDIAEEEEEGYHRRSLSASAGKNHHGIVYVMRHIHLRWSREVLGLVLTAIYATRGVAMLKSRHVDDDGIAGTRILLVAGGWLLLSQLEEVPGLGPQPTNRSPTPLALHPVIDVLVNDKHDGGIDAASLLINVEGLQLLLAIIIFVLLICEALLGLKESRRRSDSRTGGEAASFLSTTSASTAARGNVKGSSCSCFTLFKDLKVPPTPEQTASLLSILSFW